MTALAALLPLVLAVPAQAFSDTLDQSMVQVFSTSFQGGVPFMAQTFTAGMTGQVAVDRVSLPVYTPTGFAMWTVTLNKWRENYRRTARMPETGRSM